MDQNNERDWLSRLSPEDWVAAAVNELQHCKEALERRSHRAGVTHARRAAGMALNALLRLNFRPEWGRSYMDHIVALAQDAAEPESLRLAAKTLAETRPLPPELISIGKPDLKAFEAAQEITEWVTRVLKTPTTTN